MRYLWNGRNETNINVLYSLFTYGIVNESLNASHHSAPDATITMLRFLLNPFVCVTAAASHRITGPVAHVNSTF